MTKPETYRQKAKRLGLPKQFSTMDLLNEIERLQQELEREERDHMATIQDRDAAEEAMSTALNLVTGIEAQWSNLYGYAEALADIDETMAALQPQPSDCEVKNHE